MCCFRGEKNVQTTRLQSEQSGKMSFIEKVSLVDIELNIRDLRRTQLKKIFLNLNRFLNRFLKRRT